MAKRKEGADLARAWDRGRPADIRRSRSPTTVLSVRVSDEVLERLSSRAHQEGTSVSDVARRLLERGLDDELPGTPTELARAFARWVDEARDLKKKRA